MRSAGDRGNTLMEVIAVMVLISALSLVAYTTMQSLKDGVSDVETQQRLLQLGGGQSLYFSTRGDFAAATPTTDALEDIEDSFDYTLAGLAVTGTGQISVAVDDVIVGAQTVRMVGMAALGPSGECYTLRVADPGTDVSGSMGRWDPDDDLRPCSGAEALLVVGEAW